MLFLLIVPFWTNSLIRIYGLKDFPQYQRLSQRIFAVAGVIDTPLRIMYTPRR